jgi:lambda family phage portal protein
MPVAAPTPPSNLGRILDRVARELSPSWFARRQSQRLRGERAAAVRELIAEHRERISRRHRFDDVGLRRFDAASQTPRTQGWIAPLTAPDAALGPALDRLRQRSRDLSRNNPWATKACRAIPSHMVRSGIRATLNHSNPETKKKAQALWDAWFESSQCDADGRTNGYGLERLVVRQVVEAGEVLARFRLRRQSDGLDVPLQVQVVEADHIDSTRDNSAGVSSLPSARRQRQGIEFDARGKRAGYWLFPEHPAYGMLYKTSVFVPADNVAHVYRVERPGQVRGIPWGAPCLLSLRDLGDWADATMLRTKLAACFAAFVTTDADLDDPDAVAATPTGKDVEDLEPGLVEYLRPGQTVSFTNPPGVEGMDEFPKVTLRGIAVGYGVPVHVLTGDLSDVNFSSARIGNLDFDAELEAWREDWLVPQFLQPLFAAWLSQAFVAGQLPEDVTVSWTPPPAPLIDPKVDLEAAKARVRGGVSTMSEEQRRAGWRPEELREEMAADLKAMDDLDLASDWDPRKPEAGSPSPPAESANDPNAPPKPGKGKPGAAPPAKPKAPPPAE